MAQKINVRVLGLSAPPYYLIVVIERSLKSNKQTDQAIEFAKRASLLQSAEGIIELAKEYVNVI
jgi:hypothetical protein